VNSAYRSGSLWQLAVLWTLLMAVSLLTRTFVPIDETRYVTVAWEMWLRGDFLVPHLNGATYAHKPPLLFWLYDLGWWLFGVNDWWPRLVAPLFGLGSLFLTFLLARRLWPDRPQVALLASWLLFGSVFWTGYTTAAMFDMLVTFFTLLGLYGIWQAGQGRRSGWLWLPGGPVKRGDTRGAGTFTCWAPSSSAQSSHCPGRFQRPFEAARPMQTPSSGARPQTAWWIPSPTSAPSGGTCRCCR